MCLINRRMMDEKAIYEVETIIKEMKYSHPPSAPSRASGGRIKK